MYKAFQFNYDPFDMTLQLIRQAITCLLCCIFIQQDQNMIQLKRYLQKCRVRFGISANMHKGIKFNIEALNPE